jgi:hypothetical protein
MRNFRARMPNFRARGANFRRREAFSTDNERLATVYYPKKSPCSSGNGKT